MEGNIKRRSIFNNSKGREDYEEEEDDAGQLKEINDQLIINKEAGGGGGKEEEEEEDLPSSTPLKFTKGDNNKKIATAEESEPSSEERKRKTFRGSNEAKITFFGFEASELVRFAQSRKVNFELVEEGGNFIKCVCRCSEAFPTQKSFLRLDGAVFEENEKTVGVMMDEESAAALPKTPRINTKVFDSSYCPENNGNNKGFGWFGLSWLFEAIHNLF